MTNDEIREIDEVLEANGVRYDPKATLFLSVGRPEHDPVAIEWHEVLVLLGDMDVNQLTAYEAAKQADYHKSRGQGHL
jgi:hypothetical protein